VSDPSTPTPSEFLDDAEGADAVRAHGRAEGDADQGAGSSPELGDDVAQQSATGMSGGDADQHAGEQAPASEGRLPGGA
jgi:hypothetical protein